MINLNNPGWTTLAAVLGIFAGVIFGEIGLIIAFVLLIMWLLDLELVNYFRSGSLRRPDKDYRNRDILLGALKDIRKRFNMK